MEGKIYKTRLIANLLLITFWVMGTYCFVLQEFALPLFQAVNSFISLAADIIIAILGIWTLRNRYDKLLLLFYLLLSITSALINNNSFIFWLNGSRHYISYIFILPILRYLTATQWRREYFINLFDRNLYAFLWLQVPCMVYQCILYGAFDNVGGSLGWMMSGIISTLIYMISFYLMLRRWNSSLSYFENLKKNWILLMLLIPSYLNETKISFIFLAMYFFFLIPMDRKFLKRLAVIFPTMVLIMLFAGFLYFKFVNADTSEVLSKDFITVYLQGDDDMIELVEYLSENAEGTETNEGDYPRFAKFGVVPLVLKNKAHAPYIGFGAGQFKGGTFIEKSDIAKKYGWLLKGTQMQAMNIILDLGWVGMFFFFCFLWVLFHWGARCPNQRNAQIQWYLTITTLLILLYSCHFLSLVFSTIFIYIGFMSSNWKWVKEAEQRDISRRQEEISKDSEPIAESTTE